jgi:hypothetical protein
MGQFTQLEIGMTYDSQQEAINAQRAIQDFPKWVEEKEKLPTWIEPVKDIQIHDTEITVKMYAQSSKNSDYQARMFWAFVQEVLKKDLMLFYIEQSTPETIIYWDRNNAKEEVEDEQ